MSDFPAHTITAPIRIHPDSPFMDDELERKIREEIRKIVRDKEERWVNEHYNQGTGPLADNEWEDKR